MKYFSLGKFNHFFIFVLFVVFHTTNITPYSFHQIAPPSMIQPHRLFSKLSSEQPPPMKQSNFNGRMKATSAEDSEENSLLEAQYMELIYEADYGFLPDNHTATQYLRQRLKTLLPQVEERDLPIVKVLATTGEGVNAFVLSNGTIVLSPELLTFFEFQEEIDFVLMHELNHWFKKHFSQLDQAQKQSHPLLPVLGHLRFHEYEADMAAFLQMAEEERNTNPLGAIAALERFRNEEAKSKKKAHWDIAHGDTTDRILNLKSMLRFQDLIQNQELHLIEESLPTSVSQLEPGGHISRLLKSPPTDNYAWDKWILDIASILEKADWKLLHSVIRPITQKLKFYQHKQTQIKRSRYATYNLNDIYIASYSSLLRHALTRWQKLFQKKFASFKENEKTIYRALLLETGAGIPVFSEPEDSVVSNFNLKKIGQDFKRLLNKQQTLAHLLEIYSKLDIPIEKNELIRFASKAVQAAYADEMAFDLDESKIDVHGYLEKSALAIIAANQAPGFLLKESLFSTQMAWTQAVFQGIFVLIDLNQWKKREKEFDSLVKDISKKHGKEILILNLTEFQNLLTTFGKKFPEITNKIRTYITKQWGAPLTVQETIKELKKLKSEILEIFQSGHKEKDTSKLKGLLLKASDLLHSLPVEVNKSLAMKVLSKENQDRWRRTNKKEKEKLLEKLGEDYMSKVLSNKNLELRILEEKSYVSRDFILSQYLKDITQIAKKKLSLETFLTLIYWAKITFSEDLMFEDFLDELEQIKSHQFNFLEESDKIADAVANAEQTREFFNQEPRLKKTSIRLENREVWKAQLLIALSNKLNNKTYDAENFFEQLRLFLERWPIIINIDTRQSKSDYDGLFADSNGEDYYSESPSTKEKNKILKKGLQHLTPLPLPLSKKDEERLFLLSFFIRDPAIQRPFQEFLLTQIAKELPLKEILDLIFEKYSCQNPAIGFQLLDLLDAKAETPEEIELLKQTGKNWLNKSKTTLESVGQGIILDGLMTYFIKEEKRMEIFKALIFSSKDENRLRDLIENFLWTTPDRWRFQNALIRKVTEIKNQEQYDNFKNEKLPYDTMISGEGCLLKIYRLGTMARYLLLRKLLSGDEGILGSSNGRTELLNTFFAANVETNQNAELGFLLREILGEIFESVPQDELYLMMEKLLESRITIPPPQPGTWKTFAMKRAKYLVGREDCCLSILIDTLIEKNEELKFERDEDILLDHLGIEPIAAQVEAFLSGSLPGVLKKTSVENRFYDLIPQEMIQRESNVLSPIELILNLAQKMGAPGVRFLQLLGQVVDLPNEYCDQFFQVYDSIKGQSKVSAWEIIKREDPAYADKVAKIGRRLGGGSLFTVYLVTLKDGTTEVVRVLNPNALYHTRNTLTFMRLSLHSLAFKDQKYKRGLPLLDLLEQWIEQELKDVTFEEDDKLFRSKWHEWNPKGFSAMVVIPFTTPTKTKYVHREEAIDGKNFTAIKEFFPAQQKEMVALAVQHYIQQIKGGLFERETLVHSDISPGNLRITTDGNLAILDRGMYLKFNMAERLQLLQLTQASDVAKRTEVLLDWVWKLPENEKIVPKLSREKIQEEIMHKVTNGNKVDQEEAMIRTLVVLSSNGLKIPLKFNLLFKNLNVLQRMAKQVGFSSFKEAMQYVPSLAAKKADELNRDAEKGAKTVEHAI